MHCADCKEKTQNGLILWVVDSGASVHLTGDKSDFSELKLFTENERPLPQTANGAAAIHGSGTVFIKTYVDNTPDKMMTLYPAYHRYSICLVWEFVYCQWVYS